jgi:hypothetical protein
VETGLYCLTLILSYTISLSLERAVNGTREYPPTKSSGAPPWLDYIALLQRVIEKLTNDWKSAFSIMAVNLNTC